MGNHGLGFQKLYQIYGMDKLLFIENKAERGFGLLTQAAKPSETLVVHQNGHPFHY